MAEISMHEITRYLIPVLKLEEPIVTWHNNFMTVRSHKGVHIFEFQQNLKNFSKKLISEESFVDTTKSSPATNLFTKSVLNNHLGNLYLNEMIVDQTLWPHNPLLMLDACVTYFHWSPFGLIGNHGSVLAVLNNVGGVDLFVKGHKWQCVVKLSESFSDAFLSNLGAPKTFHELRIAAHVLASTTICWSDSLNNDNSCFLATGQRSGNIMFWLVTTKQLNVTATLSGYFEQVSNEVVSLTWITTPQHNKFLLICTDILGKIIVLNCAIVNNSEVKLVSKHAIWPHEDKMITNSLRFIMKDEKIIIFCNKFRFLLGFMLDKDLNVIDEYIKNINDYKVTCVSLKNEEFYVTTINCEIYKLSISIKQKKLNVNLTLINCKDIISPVLELHSISWSRNSAMCTLGIIDRRIQHRKESTKIDLILVSEHTIDSLTNILLNNPSKKLTYYWDVVELLRYKAIKQKQLPSIDYENLYQMGSSDIYMLKLYSIFVYIYNNLLSMLKILPIKLPEHSIDIIEEEILVLHADNEMRRYFKKHKREKLNGFEMECFVGARKFLEHYFEKDGKDIRNIIESEILDITNKDYQHTCQSCDEKLSGFYCKDKHLNIYCMLTFTLIEGFSYLKCNWCNSTSRIELLPHKPLCLFCDIDLKLML